MTTRTTNETNTEKQSPIEPSALPPCFSDWYAPVGSVFSQVNFGLPLSAYPASGDGSEGPRRKTFAVSLYFAVFEEGHCDFEGLG